MSYQLVDGAGIWKLHATYGIPVEIGLLVAERKGYIPTWDTLITAARKDGTNIPRLKRRLVAAASDTYPKHISQAVKEKL